MFTLCKPIEVRVETNKSKPLQTTTCAPKSLCKCCLVDHWACYTYSESRSEFRIIIQNRPPKDVMENRAVADEFTSHRRNHTATFLIFFILLRAPTITRLLFTLWEKINTLFKKRLIRTKHDNILRTRLKCYCT